VVVVGCGCVVGGCFGGASEVGGCVRPQEKGNAGGGGGGGDSLLYGLPSPA